MTIARHACHIGGVIVLLLAMPGRINAESGYFGVAQLTINPTTPIRLTGYASRDPLPEASAVQQSIKAQAAAFGMDADTSLLISVDSTGVPDNVVDSVSATLSANFGIARERIVVSSTHTHSGPQIDGFATNIFDSTTSRALTPIEQQHVTQYTSQLTGWLQQVAVNALNNRAPGHQISWGQGSVGFGQNRRGTAIAPNDHDLPVMRVTDSQGGTKAIITSYATHATTLNGNDNLVSGDWPGYARASIQGLYPGAIALVMIGAAGDSDPSPQYGASALTYAQNHGQAVATEVQRLINQGLMRPVSFSISASHSEIELPFATQRLPGDPASARVAPAPGSIPYGITSWTFGDSLAMAFLEGELTVDYSLRLKSELNDGRLWVNGYSNDVQAYIPSERILYEGGYEPDDASYWYAQPGRFAHGIEDRVIGAVHQQLDPFFHPIDRLSLVVDWGTGAVEIRNNTGGAIALDAYSIVSANNRLDRNSNAWFSLQQQGTSGWDEADNANSSRLTEFNPTGSLIMSAGGSATLGRPFIPAAPSSFGQDPNKTDLTFEYDVPGQGTKKGAVEYTGRPNNLVLTIDPATGGVAIQNESSFFNVEIEAYMVTSTSGRLLAANGKWNSLQDQSLSGWDEADNASNFRLIEFNPTGQTALAGGGTVLNLGTPVDIAGSALSASDFLFQFALANGTILNGVVVLGSLPTVGLPGDYNHNNVVDAADYVLWPKANSTPAGYNIWRANFGLTFGSGSGSSATSIPEPSTLALVTMLTIGFALLELT